MFGVNMQQCHSGHSQQERVVLTTALRRAEVATAASIEKHGEGTASTGRGTNKLWKGEYGCGKR